MNPILSKASLYIPLFNTRNYIGRLSSASDEVLQLQHDSDFNLRAALTRFKDDTPSYSQAIELSFPHLGSLRNLSNLTPQDWARFFSVRVTRLQEGAFKVTLDLRLVGGGGCTSTPAQDVPLETRYFTEASLPVSPLIPLGNALPFKSALHIASALKQLSPDDPAYASAKKFALEMINNFGQRGLKDKAIVEEIATLALAEHHELSHALVTLFLNEIRDSSLLNIDILKALHLTLQYAPIEALDPDDLVATLKILFEKMAHLHKQDKTSSKCYQTLRLISEILDTMGDANVIELERLDVHERCYEILDVLSRSQISTLAAEAAYAKQALVRIPNNEAKLSQFIRRGLGIVKGVAHLASAGLQPDPAKLFEAFDSFAGAAKFQDSSDRWYDEMRLVKLLMEVGHFPEAETFLLQQAERTQTKPFTLGLIHQLHTLALSHPVFEVKKGAFCFLEHIFLQDESWHSEESVQKEVIFRLRALTSHPEENFSLYARDALEALPRKANSPKQKRALDRGLKEPLPYALQRVAHKKPSFIGQGNSSLTLFALTQKQLQEIDPAFEKPAVQHIQLKAPHPDFVGRVLLLKNLDEMLVPIWNPKAPAPVKVLQGPGGSGKSELAIAFANNHLEQFSVVWLIHTESKELFDQDLRELALELKIPIEKESAEEIQKRLYRRLEQGVEGKPWLLIFDNVEKPLSLPERGGYLLLTTRYRDVYENKRAFLEVGPFSLDETSLLSEKILGEPLPGDEIEELHKILQGSAVLLNLAFHYMGETSCSTEEYAKRVDSGFPLEEASERYPRSLAQVVQISAAYLLEKNPLAHQFFLLCAHLNPDRIPIFLLNVWLERQNIGHLEENRRKILMALRDSSLINESTQKSHLTMHRLTQVACQKEERAKEAFSELLTLLFEGCNSFDPHNPKTWEKGEEVALQIETLKQNPFWNSQESKVKGELLSIVGNWLETVKEQEKTALDYHREALEVYLRLNDEPGIARSYNDLGCTLNKLGRSKESLDFHQKGLALKLKIYGDSHLEVGRSYGNRGTTFQSLGQPQEALESYQKGLEILLKIYGESHRSVAITYNNIGVSLRNLGRIQESLEWGQKALNLMLKMYGEVHPDVALCYKNVGNTLERLGRLQEGLKFKQTGLALRLQIYGETHPAVAESYSSIAGSLDGLEKFKEALEFKRKGLDVRVKLFTELHCDVASSYTSIGNTLESLGQFEEALESKKKALAILLKIYEEDHSLIADSYSGIGASLQKLGRHLESIEFHQKALNIRLKFYGEVHPDVASSYRSIGIGLVSLGRYQESLEFHQKALEVRVKLYGEVHPDVADCYESIGSSLRGLEKNEESLKACEKGLEIRRKIYGEVHPNVAISYTNIGVALNQLGQFKKALESYEKALHLELQIYGDSHSNVAASYDQIGHCLEDLGRYPESLASHQKALEIRRKIYGESHPTVAESYSRVGDSLRGDGKYKEALESLQKGLDISLKCYGEVHVDVADNYDSIGTTLDFLDRSKEALEFKRKALQIREKIYGDSHISVAGSYNNIGTCLEKLGRSEEALEAKQKALTMKIKLYGESHPEVARTHHNIGVTLQTLGRSEEALVSKRKALAQWLEVYGEGHSTVADSYLQIGWSLNQLGQLEEALEFYQKSLDGWLKARGESHPAVAECYRYIVAILEKLGRKAEAFETQKKALRLKI